MTRLLLLSALVLSGCAGGSGAPEACTLPLSTPYTTNDACLGCHQGLVPGVNMHPGPCVQCHVAGSPEPLSLVAPPGPGFCGACHQG